MGEINALHGSAKVQFWKVILDRSYPPTAPILKPDEKELVNILQQNGKLPIDSICLRAKLPMSKVSSALLNLEFQGLVRSLPGKIYVIA